LGCREEDAGTIRPKGPVYSFLANAGGGGGAKRKKKRKGEGKGPTAARTIVLYLEWLTGKKRLERIQHQAACKGREKRGGRLKKQTHREKGERKKMGGRGSNQEQRIYADASRTDEKQKENSENYSVGKKWKNRE